MPYSARRFVHAWVLAFALAPCLSAPARAGVVNPDISVIGQPFMRWTDAAGDAARRRATLDPGETEIVFDADLNPYARGTFVASLASDGMSLEEGYFTLARGLPAGLALTAGRYRVPFGRLNPAHPHTDAMLQRFHVLGEYLPGGEDGYGDTGVDVSKLVALPGDASLTARADWLNGDPFRLTRGASGATNDPLALDADGDRAAEPRPAALGRLAAFAMLGERSGLELGVSAMSGTNDVAARARSTLFGADAKAKLWRGASQYLLLQAEVIQLDRDVAGWDSVAAAYTRSRVTPAGGYVLADWNFSPRYDAGVAYEHWQSADATTTASHAFQAFAGLALMEETTSFRIGWEHWRPGRAPGATSDPEPANTVTLRVLFSMGPHKAHQF